MRIRNKEMKFPKRMVAACMVCMLIGGVSAAMILSNQISAGFDVYTTLPFNLTFATDPSDSYMKMGDSATGSIEWICTQAVMFDTTMLITVNAPVDTVLTWFKLTVGGTVIALSGSLGEFTGTKDTGNIGNSGTGTWAIIFEILSADSGTQGHWTVSFILQGDPI